MKNSKQTFSGKTILLEVITNVKGECKYKHLNGENRKVDESHVKRLMDSFALNGTASVKVTVMRTRAFNGRIEYYLVDGQHSIIACNRLDLSYNVFVVELEIDTMLNLTRYIATLNNTAKAWSNNNYLTAFAKNGLKEYIIVADILKTTGLKITDILYIFLGGASSKENKLFKSGDLHFVNEADSMELLEATLMVKELIPNKAFVRRSLYKVMRLSKDYKKMAKAIVKAYEGLEIAQDKFSENETEFYNHLVRIYKKTFNVK